jgi:ribulose-phosphate 3-epimerase
VYIAPSILSADFGALREQIAIVEDAGADFIHVDVMDGHFVPNLTIGPPVVAALKSCARVPLDVHLMIDNADATVEWYLDAGADVLTIHIEACDHIHRVLQTIRAAGASPAVSLNPGTPLDTLSAVLGDVDMILVMSVNPGFGGQSFIPSAVERVEQLAAMCASAGASPVIQVDGGIDTRTAPLVAAAGARALVAGSAVFGTDDPPAAMNAIREAAAAAI